MLVPSGEEVFSGRKCRKLSGPPAASGIGQERDKDRNKCPVAIVERQYPFPFRTRKSSSLTPMILRFARGKVGSCRAFFFNFEGRPDDSGAAFFLSAAGTGGILRTRERGLRRAGAVADVRTQGGGRNVRMSFLRYGEWVRDGLLFPDFFSPGDRAPAGRAVDGPARRFGVRFIYFFSGFSFCALF